MVGITGKSSFFSSHISRLRLNCFRISVSASSAPGLSNLFSTTKSAKSSAASFSNCDGAPYSLVVTYIDKSATSVMASLPWPIPLVSTKIRSKPTAWQASIALSIQSAISLPLALLANERMNRLSSARLFIRILSPSSAPPVRLRVGSVARRATLAPGLSRWIRNINSSVRLDFPAPPVPVNPTTGHPESASTERTLCRTAWNSESSAFSAKVSNLDMEPWSSALIALLRELNLEFSSKSIFRASSIAFSTIPVRPISLPSSGEYMRAISSSLSFLISQGRIVPPPPPQRKMCPNPASSSISLVWVNISTAPPW